MTNPKIFLLATWFQYTLVLRRSAPKKLHFSVKTFHIYGQIFSEVYTWSPFQSQWAADFSSCSILENIFSAEN